MSTLGATQIVCGLGGRIQRPSIQAHRAPTQSQCPGTHTYPGPGAGTTGVTTAATGGGGGTEPTTTPTSTCAAKIKQIAIRTAPAMSSLLVFMRHLCSRSARCWPLRGVIPRRLSLSAKAVKKLLMRYSDCRLRRAPCGGRLGRPKEVGSQTLQILKVLVSKVYKWTRVSKQSTPAVGPERTQHSCS
jgi:hypothetical protein